MQQPRFLVALAENFHAACPGFVRSVQYHLQLAVAAFGFVFMSVIRQDQWAVQLEVLRDCHTGSIGEDRRGCHGPIQSAGCHHSSEYPVVANPCRIRRRQVGFERYLTPGGIMPNAKQRMTSVLSTPFGGLIPKPAPLEGVVRNGNPPSFLAGEHSLEPDIQPCLIRTGRCLHES